MPGKCIFSENWTSHMAYKDWILRSSSSQRKAGCHFTSLKPDLSRGGWGGDDHESDQSYHGLGGSRYHKGVITRKGMTMPVIASVISGHYVVTEYCY